MTVDLTNCDIEPIHIPGQIQSHGFLIVIDPTFTIRFHSENVSEYLPDIPENLLGIHINTLKPLIGRNEPPDFLVQLISLGKSNGFEQTNPFATDILGKPFYLIISPAASYYVLEFEPAFSDTTTDVQKMIGRSISEILIDKNLLSILNNSANQIKKVIDYDRVMIYRFAEDGHGEVVAEAKNDDLPSWLGLHYPASDIPKQARELYKINLTRLIANVHTVPSRIVGDAEAAKQPLDLTYSQLRAVSPIHIQYLKNMEVDSSFSISLLYGKELWGLIACHNYTPRFIDFKSRESAKLIGQILSSALEYRQDEENQQIADKYKSSVDRLSSFMHKRGNIEDALTQKDITLLDVADAHGAVLAYDKNIVKLGITPDDLQIESLIDWYKNSIHQPFYYTDQLSSVYPAASEYSAIASGLMASTLSAELNEYIFWFKPEQVQTINWAGNPEKTGEIAPNGLMNISPRQSFEVWSQTVSGTSKSWGKEEIKSVMRLKAEVISAINQKAGEIRILNEKLKQAYEELDTFSFTISHDLKNPLSAVKSYTQIIMRSGEIDVKTREFLERILASSNKMQHMIDEVLHYSRIGRSELVSTQVDLGTIIPELVKDIVAGMQIGNLDLAIGSAPPVSGDPMMLSQVFSNLLSNAIKYSQNSKCPTVRIEGVETENEVTYSIRDNGIGIAIRELPNVFELFKRMDNAKDIEGSGVGLAIVKRIVEKHQGKIWVDSELHKGSTFYVSFKKQ